MTNKCKVCQYLKKKETHYPDYINGLIRAGTSYEKIKKECSDGALVPEERLFEQHKKECLKSYATKPLNNITAMGIAESPVFSFENFDNKPLEDRVDNLRKEWVGLAEKLTQIAVYNLSKYNPDITTTKDSLKETIGILKTVTDLYRAECNFDRLDNEVDTFDILSESQVKGIKAMQDEILNKINQHKGAK